MSTLTDEQFKRIVKTRDDVMELVSSSGLDAFEIVAVLSKCLIDYAIHIENREEFYIRMAMSYDFEKAKQPSNKEVH